MTIHVASGPDWLGSNGRPHPHRRRLQLIIIYLLAVLAYGLAFAFLQREPLPGKIYALGVLIFATSLWPLAAWAARTRRRLPIFELIVFSYALQYSMPLYTQPQGLIIFSQFVPVSWQALYEALWLVEIGLIAFIAGYYLFLRSVLAAAAPRLDLPFSNRRLQTYIYLSFLVSGIVMILDASDSSLLQASALGALTRLAAGQFNIALILLGYQVYEQRRARPGRLLLLYAATAFAFLIGLSTGMLENALIPLVSLFLVRWQGGRRFPWPWLAAGLALFMVLNPAKGVFRNMVWFGESDYSLRDRISLWSDLTIDSTETLVQPAFAADREEVMLRTLSRFDLIHRFAYVRTMTPQIVPYYEGATYAYFLVAWIPRLLWPDKPTATGGANDRMDVDYQLKYEGQAVSVGIGLLPEAYANFGLLGVVLVMALQGAIFGLLYAMLNSSGSQGGRAIYLGIGIYFLNGIGTSASVMFGGVFQQILANAVILRLFARGWRARRGQAPAAGKTDAMPALAPPSS